MILSPRFWFLKFAVLSFLIGVLSYFSLFDSLLEFAFAENLSGPKVSIFYGSVFFLILMFNEVFFEFVLLKKENRQKEEYVELSFKNDSKQIFLFIMYLALIILVSLLSLIAFNTSHQMLFWGWWQL